jgi:single-stranded DNA-binding protein
VSIDCAFYGFLAADAEPRTSAAGKPWVRLRVGVGKDDAIQWVSVAVFGKAAESAGELKKADRVYCEGSIKLDTWRGSDGVERHGLSVAAFKCEHTHQIGRLRPRRDQPVHKIAAARRRRDPIKQSPYVGADPDLNDDLPF